MPSHSRYIFPDERTKCRDSFSPFAITFLGELFILNTGDECGDDSAADNALAEWIVQRVRHLRVFLTLLPTIVLMAVYFLCRRGMNRKKQIEKMNIQDL